MMSRLDRDNDETIQDEDLKLDSVITEDTDNSGKRKRILSKLSIIFFITLILIISLFYYMRFIETNKLDVNEYKITSSNLPAEFHGYKVVHFSDIHYLMVNDYSYMEKLINKINYLEPDIVLFTGDLLDSSINYTEKDYKNLSAVLNKIDTNYKYYIKGEEDYNFENIDEIFSNANFISVNNGYEFIYKSNDSRIVINGLGSSLSDDFNIADSFNFIESPFTITLFHEPDDIDKLGDYNIDLALSGHSHNNQINLPFINNLFTVDGARKYYKKYYNVNGTSFYINQGIGTNGSRYRLFNKPTINLYRLTSR